MAKKLCLLVGSFCDWWASFAKVFKGTPRLLAKQYGISMCYTPSLQPSMCWVTNTTIFSVVSFLEGGPIFCIPTICINDARPHAFVDVFGPLHPFTDCC